MRFLQIGAPIVYREFVSFYWIKAWSNGERIPFSFFLLGFVCICIVSLYFRTIAYLFLPFDFPAARFYFLFQTMGHFGLLFLLLLSTLSHLSPSRFLLLSSDLVLVKVLAVNFQLVGHAFEVLFTWLPQPPVQSTSLAHVPPCFFKHMAESQGLPGIGQKRTDTEIRQFFKKVKNLGKIGNPTDLALARWKHLDKIRILF